MGKLVHMKRAVPKPHSELPLVDGCVYVTGIGQKGKVSFKIFCHKIVEKGSEYCPKHRLYAEDEGKEVGRRHEEHKKKREHKEVESAALALSPLKADNPQFDKDRYEMDPERK